jgi:acetyl esterase/lipase
MQRLNRRRVLGLGVATGAAALAPLSWRSSAARQATASVSAPIDPRSLIPPELLRPLEGVLAKWGTGDIDASNLPELRKTIAAQSAAVQTRGVERRVIPGPPGAPGVPVYIINAGKGGARRPAILHMHGGGFIFGTARQAVPELQKIAHELDCVAVTVDYRLAPETRFPGPLEDNYSALRWLWRSASELGVDTGRIVVMGESAGGGHAAMLAIAARDRREFKLAAQILIYPMLDDRTGSSRTVPPYIGTFIWTRGSNRFGWSSLLGQPAGGKHVPYGSVPSRVADLSRLPPTFIGVGSIDLFVEEDVEYARRLLDSGVQVELNVVPGAYHGFDGIAPDAPLTHRFRAAELGALRRAFA